jgi:hypothetical protein
MIDDFIKQATSQLGISEQAAKSATGGVLGMLQKQAAPNDFSKLLGAVPGADGLLKQFGGATSAPAGGGGLLGAAMGLLGGAKGGGGGGLGDIASLVGLLGNSGISADKAPNFLGMLMGFFQQKAGGDVMGGIMKNLPDLAKLIK